MVLEKRNKTGWYWLVQILKYGAGIIIALISIYAAKQEKAHETMLKLKAAYGEQSKQVVELQNRFQSFEKANKDTVTACKAEVETIRSNMIFFLMGANKASPHRQAFEDQKKLLEKLVQGAPRRKLPTPAMPFKRPRKFEDLPVQKKAD